MRVTVKKITESETQMQKPNENVGNEIVESIKYAVMGEFQFYLHPSSKECYIYYRASGGLCNFNSADGGGIILPDILESQSDYTDGWCGKVDAECSEFFKERPRETRERLEDYYNLRETENATNISYSIKRFSVLSNREAKAAEGSGIISLQKHHEEIMRQLYTAGKFTDINMPEKEIYKWRREDLILGFSLVRRSGDIDSVGQVQVECIQSAFNAVAATEVLRKVVNRNQEELDPNDSELPSYAIATDEIDRLKSDLDLKSFINR
jgi:hypothetical protein